MYSPGPFHYRTRERQAEAAHAAFWIIFALVMGIAVAIGTY